MKFGYLIINQRYLIWQSDIEPKYISSKKKKGKQTNQQKGTKMHFETFSIYVSVCFMGYHQAFVVSKQNKVHILLT